MADKKEAPEIKFDFDVTIKTLKGEPLKELNEQGTAFTDEDVTMRSYLANALWNAREKEEANVTNAMLAMKIFNAKGPIVLKVEERTAIKNLIKKKSRASDGVFYQIDCFLEGKDPFATEE